MNVKEVALDDVATSGLAVTRDLTINPRELPGELRRLTSQLFKAQKAGEWEETEGGIRFPGVMADGEAVVLAPGQFTLSTGVTAEEGSSADVLASGTFVVLDTTLDAELEAEGYARDLVRTIQDARKEAGLHIADRIALALEVPADRVGAVETHTEFIAAETLATSLEVSASADGEVRVARLDKVQR